MMSKWETMEHLYSFYRDVLLDEADVNQPIPIIFRDRCPTFRAMKGLATDFYVTNQITFAHPDTGEEEELNDELKYKLHTIFSLFESGVEGFVINSATTTTLDPPVIPSSHRPTLVQVAFPPECNIIQGDDFLVCDSLIMGHKPQRGHEDMMLIGHISHSGDFKLDLSDDIPTATVDPINFYPVWFDDVSTIINSIDLSNAELAFGNQSLQVFYCLLETSVEVP
jgi:hypothetical protein